MGDSGIRASLSGIEAEDARLAAAAHDIAGANAPEHAPVDVDLSSQPIGPAGVGERAGVGAQSREAPRDTVEISEEAAEVLRAKRGVSSSARALGVLLQSESSLLDVLA